MLSCPSNSFILLLLLLFGHHLARADQPGERIGNDWLVQIQVLTRHGDRAAQNDPYITENAEEAFFRGPGELSTEGMVHAKEIGAQYREAYVTKSNFLNGKFDPHEAKFVSTAVNRVLMTASSFSTGLFVDRGIPVMAPVYTVPYDDDTLLAINFNCQSGWEDMKKKYMLNDTVDMPDQILEAMRASDDWTCADPTSAQSDTVIAEMANSLTRPQLNDRQQLCASDGALKFMFKYVASLSGTGSNETDARPRIIRTIGRLANETVDTFNTMRDCYLYRGDNYTCDPFEGMAHFRFAHDVNLLALMDVFSRQEGSKGFFQGNTPAYGASLVSELWVRDNDKFFVKMFLLNGAGVPFVEFRFCDYFPAEIGKIGRYCSLDALEAAKNAYVGGSDEIEC